MKLKFFLDYRGKTNTRNIYTQSNLPVVEQHEAWGHAVRAGYMYAGMADIAALTKDSAYIKAIDRIWNNIVSKKYYLTGGVGDDMREKPLVLITNYLTLQPIMRRVQPLLSVILT